MGEVAFIFRPVFIRGFFTFHIVEIHQFYIFLISKEHISSHF